MAIELTEDQRRAMGASADRPARVIDPTTKETYVLVPEDVYEELRTLLEEEKAERFGWLELAEEARTTWMRENPY